MYGQANNPNSIIPKQSRGVDWGAGFFSISPFEFFDSHFTAMNCLPLEDVAAN